MLNAAMFSRDTCERCVQRALLVFWVLLIVCNVLYLCIAAASLLFFGGFRHESFVFYRRANIETLVVAVLGGVAGLFGVFGTTRVYRRVVLGAVLVLLATFVLLVAAAVSARRLKNPFREHDSAMATSELMGDEIAEYVARASPDASAPAANASAHEEVLRFMTVAQRIFQCCGKASHADYRQAPVPRSCCRNESACALPHRTPAARDYDKRVFYHTGCLYHIYWWVVLVTLAGLNLAAFCAIASACLALSGVFLFLHRNKNGVVSLSARSNRTVGSVSSRRSAADPDMVVVVVEGWARQSAPDQVRITELQS